MAAASGERVVDVGDHGAVGDGVADDRAAIQTAIDAALAGEGAAVVRLGEGKTYRLAPHADSIAALSIVRGQGVRLDGRGSTLRVHPSSRALAVFESESIGISNLTIDYDPLPYTQGRIGSVDGSSVRFRVDEGYPAPVEGGVETYPDHKSSDCVFIDGPTRRFNHEWRRVRRMERLPGGEWRATFHERPSGRSLEATRPGDFIAVKIPYPGLPMPRSADGRFITTGSGNIQIAFCSGVVVSNVTSYAAPGMTLAAHGSEAVEVTALRIVRKPGTDRLVAGCSDGAHMKSLTVMPRFRDCVFEALMDDSINIKVSAQKVVKTEGARILMRHADIFWNDIVVRPGDTLEFVQADETLFLGLAEVRRVEKTEYRTAWVEVDRAPDGLQSGVLAYIRPRTTGLVSNCVFRSQLKTAILTRPMTRITACLFEDVAYGVHAAQMGDGIEGPAPRGIVIEGCRFVRPWIAGVALHVKRFEAVPPGLAGIRVAGCEFDFSGKASAIRGRIPDLAMENLVLRPTGTMDREAWIDVKTERMRPERLIYVERKPGVYGVGLKP
jgi:hypothetical protein